MARYPRIDVVGVPQHIVVRGVDRQPCFFGDTDREAYLSFLIDAMARYDVALHAYVLMSNHVHLLATPAALGMISATMKLSSMRYVRHINDLYGRTGTLFEGRFRSSLVQTDRYFLACMRYIELNPVRAGMVRDAADHHWSSYRQHAGLENVPWLSLHDEYRRLARSAAERQRIWRDFVGSEVASSELATVRLHLNKNRVLGDTRFQSQVAAMVGRRVDIVPVGRQRGH